MEIKYDINTGDIFKDGKLLNWYYSNGIPTCSYYGKNYPVARLAWEQAYSKLKPKERVYFLTDDHTNFALWNLYVPNRVNYLAASKLARYYSKLARRQPKTVSDSTFSEFDL